MKDIAEFIIAHRGESYDAPENTLASIQLAWERGAKAVEIDIRLTRDNEIVVIHDKNSFRISGVKKIIKKSSLKELKLLNAGSYKDDKWKDEHIPTLSEVLKTVPKDGRLIIEIKSNDKILRKLKYELSHTLLNDTQIELIAFNIRTLTKAKRLMPHYKMLCLLNYDYFWTCWLLRINKSKIIKKIKKRNLNGVDVRAGKLINQDFISNFKNEGLFVYAWTVNKPEHARLLLEEGIDGITTDRAGWMVIQLKQMLTTNL